MCELELSPGHSYFRLFNIPLPMFLQPIFALLVAYAATLLAVWVPQGEHAKIGAKQKQTAGMTRLPGSICAELGAPTTLEELDRNDFPFFQHFLAWPMLVAICLQEIIYAS